MTNDKKQRRVNARNILKKTMEQPIIIPSTKFKVITVHKLWDISCLRKYFWYRVMNFAPKGMNFNFWYGGVFHVGFQSLLLGHKWPRIRKDMRAESRRRLEQHTLTVEIQSELALQFDLLCVFLQAAMKHPAVEKMRMVAVEKQVSYKIDNVPGIKYCGSVDGDGFYKDKPCIFEIKTATQVTPSYFKALDVDQQVHSYALGMRKLGKPRDKCCYCVFRKTQKRIKKGQTPDDFVAEIKKDVDARPNFYFGGDENKATFPYPLTLGKHSIDDAKNSIEAGAWLLNQIYTNLTPKALLQPESWPKNTRNCFNYGQCGYFALCHNLKRWKLYSRFYQQREIMYPEEEKELQNEQ